MGCEGLLGCVDLELNLERIFAEAVEIGIGMGWGRDGWSFPSL